MHGYNHALQVYKQATEHPCQGNITRVPMTFKALHGLVSKSATKELRGMCAGLEPFMHLSASARKSLTSCTQRMKGVGWPRNAPLLLWPIAKS